MKLRIAYFYPELLNLYGDRGNVDIMAYRARKRNIDVEVLSVNPSTDVTSHFMKAVDFVFAGGGPDSSQKSMGDDLRINKGPYLKEFVEGGGVGLFVCGSYQLMGNHYKAADGTVIEGLGIFDVYTRHFGRERQRCVGNIVCRVSGSFLTHPAFGDTVVGFENHGGRTYLGDSGEPFGKVLSGCGNNSEDKTEGVVYKNCIGTYLHGPLFAKNPHVADYLLAKSLKLDTLTPLDDSLALAAHTTSRKLKP